MQNIIFGIIAICLGFVVTWKSYWIVLNFGRSDWAEVHLSGGTIVLYKLIGMGMILFGIFLSTGLLENILKTIFAPMFRF